MLPPPAVKPPLVCRPQSPSVSQARPAIQGAPPVYRPQGSSVSQTRPAIQNAPPVYRPRGSSVSQARRAVRGAPPVYRPLGSAAQEKRAVQAAPPVYRPQLTARSISTPAPPVYRPAPAPAAQAKAKPGQSSIRPSASATGRPGVMQMVKAYRVEYPPYKIQINGTGKITGFEGNPDGMGINISFVMPDHSEHFKDERKGDQLKNLRIVEFELSDDLWTAIQWKTGKAKKSDVKQNWLEKVEGLKDPSWSDGASLTKFIKQTALGFADKWLPVLKAGVTGTASVEYPEDDTGGLDGGDEVWAYTDDEGPEEGFTTKKSEAEENGYDYITTGRAERLKHKKY